MTRLPSHNSRFTNVMTRLPSHNSRFTNVMTRLPSHMILGFRATMLQNFGDLLLYVFSYSFFNLFFNQQEKSIPRLPTTKFSIKYTNSDDFGVYRSFCRRSDSLTAHVFICRRSCSLSLTNFFFGEDPLVFSYRKSLPRCAIKFVTQPTRRNRSQQRLLVGWGF
jgi:hypothetical protein